MNENIITEFFQSTYNNLKNFIKNGNDEKFKKLFHKWYYDKNNKEHKDYIVYDKIQELFILSIKKKKYDLALFISKYKLDKNSLYYILINMIDIDAIKYFDDHVDLFDYVYTKKGNEITYKTYIPLVITTNGCYYKVLFKIKRFLELFEDKYPSMPLKIFQDAILFGFQEAYEYLFFRYFNDDKDKKFQENILYRIRDIKTLDFLMDNGYDINNLELYHFIEMTKKDDTLKLADKILKYGYIKWKDKIYYNTYNKSKWIEIYGPIYNTLGVDYDYKGKNEKQLIIDAITKSPKIIDELPESKIKDIPEIEHLTKSDEYGLFENKIMNFKSFMKGDK